jgi:two-component system, sensor histidine kinase LadS
VKSFPILKLILWALLLAIIAIARTASAEPLILKENPCYDLSGYIEILSDPTNSLTVQQVANRNDWIGTLHGKVPNLGLRQEAIWIRFSLLNQADITKKFYVSLEYPVTNSVYFYTREVPDGFREEHTGSSTPASARVLPDRTFLFPLILEPGRTAVAYLRVQSTSSMTLPVRIMSDQALFRKAIRDYTIYGALFGVLVLVILYFITVGSFLYKGTPIWLVLYSFFFGLHVAIRGGFIRLLLPDAALGIHNLLQLVAISGLFFTGAKFFRLFLSLKSHSIFLDRIMMFFQYLSLTFIAAHLFPNPVIIVVTLTLIVINPLFSIALALYFWRKGVSNAGYFAVGWIVAHFVAVYDFFRIYGELPYQPLGEWPIPFSLLIALFFLSAALIRQKAVDHLMAETDPLTQLANRRKLDEALQLEWDRCKRLHAPLSVIMADVDHFKQYNDSFGHRAGDQYLCRIADILVNNTRRSGDLAVRYGGEEFILLLPHFDTGKAYAVAERIRNTIGKLGDGGALQQHADKITISMGVATAIPGEGMNPEDLVMEADRAMYEGKRAGRNQTVVGRIAGT